MKLALESKIGNKISMHVGIMSWLVEHASCLLTIAQIGADGKTPYARLKGRQSTQPLVQFGERVMFYRERRNHERKDAGSSRWQDGIFVGIDRRSGESICIADNSAMKARTLRRVPDNLRWDVTTLKEMTCTPWNTKGNCAKVSAPAHSPERMAETAGVLLFAPPMFTTFFGWTQSPEIMLSK